MHSCPGICCSRASFRSETGGGWDCPPPRRDWARRRSTRRCCLCRDVDLGNDEQLDGPERSSFSPSLPFFSLSRFYPLPHTSSWKKGEECKWCHTLQCEAMKTYAHYLAAFFRCVCMGRIKEKHVFLGERNECKGCMLRSLICQFVFVGNKPLGIFGSCGPKSPKRFACSFCITHENKVKRIPDERKHAQPRPLAHIHIHAHTIHCSLCIGAFAAASIRRSELTERRHSPEKMDISKKERMSKLTWTCGYEREVEC